MQSYQRPTYYGKPEHVYSAYNDEFQNANAGYRATWRLAVTPPPLGLVELEAMLAYLRGLETPAQREQLALYLGDPGDQIGSQAPIETRPDWMVVADPATYNGTYGRMLVRGQ